MVATRSFPVKAEIVLICAMLIGFALIAQQWSMTLYKVGLGIVVLSTLLEIAVGNLPKTASVGRSLTIIAVILAIVLAVFLIGIALVPYLTNLGR
ncbi:MAG: hypothetical protein E6Q98_19520 [Rhodospirillaceae bacterium]|nr:MAG: hypothetical protein E6Q98_19520 [Rhodospirillaceae bacterium]